MYMRALLVMAMTSATLNVATPSAIAGTSRRAVRPGVTSRQTVRLEATSSLTNVEAIDNAPTGTSAGDVLVFTEELHDLSGESIGSDAATCTRLFDTTMLCQGVYVLHDGQIFVQLLQPGPTGTYTQAIVGGTEKYAGAQGTVTLDQSSSGDRFTFRILLP
jgi:hypothetical protein